MNLRRYGAAARDRAAAEAAKLRQEAELLAQARERVGTRDAAG